MSEQVFDTPTGPTPEYDQFVWQSMRTRYGLDSWMWRPDASFSLEYPEERDEKNEQDDKKQFITTVGNLACDNPDLDYFSKNVMDRPKQAIGQYVSEAGIPVPLIRDRAEWEACLQGGSGMLRSEMDQDYDGIPGVLSSRRLQLADDDDRYAPFGIDKALTEMVVRGELHEKEFIELTRWTRDLRYYYHGVAVQGIPSELWMRHKNNWAHNDVYPELSYWRYVPGLNIDVFRDPHVPGRYHIGTRAQGSKVSCYVEPDTYDAEIQGRYRGEQPLTARRVIDFYEAVRELPRFDTTNVPVMELQMDDSGQLHFLQYYKTPHRLRETEPFPLPAEGIKVDYIRGVTQPEGIERRIYVALKHLSRQAIGQAIYFSGLRNSAMQSTLSRAMDVVLSDSGVNLRGSHGAKSMLYLPKVSIDTWMTELESKLRPLAYDERGYEHPRNAYIDARITANGHEAVVESDFTLHYEEDI